jgi:hypothetical protein
MINLDMRTTREIYKVGQGEESAYVIMWKYISLLTTAVDISYSIYIYH